MGLSQSQIRFAELTGKLINYIYSIPGYGVTFGEAYRTPEQAAIYAKEGKGIKESLHTERLAIDLNFFIRGFYQSNTSEYKPLGDYWKSLDPGCRWGRDFKSRPDGNHFEYRPVIPPVKVRQL